MEPRISILTLGVKDIELSREFYRDGLGFPVHFKSRENIAFFQLNGIVLALYESTALAEDACVKPVRGFSGVTIAHNVTEKEDVAAIIAQAVEAGGKELKPAQDVFWGGHSGYFADPDGHAWEVVWNPGWMELVL